MPEFPRSSLSVYHTKHFCLTDRLFEFKLFIIITLSIRQDKGKINMNFLNNIKTGTKLISARSY